jgi:4-diphosphocytidyl-2-C-methyl-D-erythritol kinase
VGELLRAVTLPALHIVVASPGAPVATAAVFSDACLTRDTERLSTPVFPLRFGRNDLQAAATKLLPAITQLKQAFLAAGAEPRMTGSGSCVFALAHHAGHSQQVAGALRQAGWQAWAVRTLAKHPLHAFTDGATI